MPLPDNVRAQTIINELQTNVVALLVRANAEAQLVHARIVAESLGGEFSQAEKDALLAFKDDLSDVATGQAATVITGRYRPNHNSERDTIGL